MRDQLNLGARSELIRVWKLLNKRDQRRIFLITGIQIFSGLLDLIGVVLIGVIGALAVSGFGTNQIGGSIERILSLLLISESTLQIQVAVIGTLAALLLILKTGFSVHFTKRILNYLSHKGAELSANSVRRTLNSSILQIQHKPHQEILFALTSGPTILMVGILGTAISLIADASLLIILGGALLFADPVVASLSIGMFVGLGLFLYKLLHIRATKLGADITELRIKSESRIVEALDSYRFLTVRNRMNYYSNEIGNWRLDLGKVQGQNSFMPYISKYVIESAVVVGSFLIAASQFLLQDATHAIATLSIFMAAGSRIAPAALRIQQGGLVIKNSLGMSGSALDFIEQMSQETFVENEYLEPTPTFVYEGFEPRISASNVTFKYPGGETNALQNISLSVTEGSLTSIVGASGSGKSTLADVLLGIQTPQLGEVYVSGIPIRETIKKWPGAIAYVPQEVGIINGTIRENVAMGFESDYISNENILEALDMAQLQDFCLALPEGIDTVVGERGTRLSGGQRQRLGIARALFSKPKLIVLDEATSALDGSTEADISAAIHNLRGAVTVVMIAHRLSTVKSSDQVIYLREGNLISQGSFDEVRKAVPDFDSQASLMGL